MLRKYLLTLYATVTKRKPAFPLLNILGLSIGLGADLLLQYVKAERNYDHFHENSENIYRVQYNRYKGLTLKYPSFFYNVGPAQPSVRRKFLRVLPSIPRCNQVESISYKFMRAVVANSVKLYDVSLDGALSKKTYDCVSCNQFYISSIIFIVTTPQ